MCRIFIVNEVQRVAVVFDSGCLRSIERHCMMLILFYCRLFPAGAQNCRTKLHMKCIVIVCLAVEIEPVTLSAAQISPIKSPHSTVCSEIPFSSTEFFPDGPASKLAANSVGDEAEMCFHSCTQQPTELFVLVFFPPSL